MDKIERLINLTACLLDTRKPVPFADLKQTVYRGLSRSDTSVKRMFERDKDELREMGIDVEAVEAESGEPGYIIPRDTYYMPHVDLEPDERVALTMVSRLFLGSGTPFSVPAQLVLLKLAFERQAAGEVPHVHWVESPRDSELLGAMLDALMRNKCVTFSYRSLGADEPVEREVEPYGLFNKGGAWYLIGMCRLRGGLRSFKLERIASGVEVNPANPKTPDFDLPAAFDMSSEIDWEWPGRRGPKTKAKVVFESRLAFAASTGNLEPTARKPLPGGRLEATYEVGDAEGFVDWVLSFGEDAMIKTPAALRGIAREKLEGILKGSAR